MPMTLDEGGAIPGEAAFKGDTEKNDHVPAMLSPGEVVLPRSITQAGDAPSKAMEFMKHLQGKAQKAGEKGESGSYAKIAEYKKALQAHLKQVEQIEKKGKK